MGRIPNGINNVDALKNDDLDPNVPESNGKEETETLDVPVTGNSETSEFNDKEETERTQGYVQVHGIISGCDSLNLREEPNTDCNVLSVLQRDSEVIVYDSESTDEFYNVCSSAGIEGYCMRQYIAIKQ